MISLARASHPVVSIVIIGLRDAPCLIDCLKSVATNVRGVHYEVLVVLNDPTDGIRRQLERQVAGAAIFPFRANLGFAMASNYAVSRSRGTYIALLNDDCLVQPDWLASLLDTMTRRPRAGVVSSTFLHPDGRLQEAGSIVRPDGTTSAVGDGLPPGYMAFERRIAYGSAGSWLVRRETWDEVGGMSEAYYPAYYEDLDFCLSAQKANWETWYQPASVVIHDRSSSTTSTIRSFIHEQSHMAFRIRWSQEISGFADPELIEDAVWRGMGCPTRVLVIDDRLPDPSDGSGFGRMYDNLMSLAGESDIHVALHPRMIFNSASSPVPGVRVVTDLPAHLATQGVDYDVVIVSRPDNGAIYRSLIDTQLPEALKIYDAEALFHRRLELQTNFADGPAREDLKAQANAALTQEKELFEWADRVVCISTEEAEVVSSLAPTPVDVVSPLFREPEPTLTNFRDRSGIGLVAGWAAGPGSPNCDGLLWFAHNVLPRIRVHQPGCTFRVTGYNPPADVRWLAGGDIDFVGEVKDLYRFYDNIRVAISPTRFGSGVKLKSVEAIQFGVPLVCTEEAADGLPHPMKRAAWITSDPATFADAVVVLLSDELAWERQRSLCHAYRDESEAEGRPSTTNWPDIIRSLVRQNERKPIA